MIDITLLGTVALMPLLDLKEKTLDAMVNGKR